MAKYIRDGRTPIPLKETTSRVMSANRAKDTKPELILRSALREKSLIGYRIHKKGIPGRPDIIFSSKKVAIFVNGCFWHQCPKCKFPLPKSNRKFWKHKFARNKKRDFLKINALKSLGWHTFVFWECDVERDAEKLVRKIQDFFWWNFNNDFPNFSITPTTKALPIKNARFTSPIFS